MGINLWRVKFSGDIFSFTVKGQNAQVAMRQAIRMAKRESSTGEIRKEGHTLKNVTEVVLIGSEGLN